MGKAVTVQDVLSQTIRVKNVAILISNTYRNVGGDIEVKDRTG